MARGVPKNYVKRSYVDDELVKNLRRDKHVVIYGSSKQGKTCLRKNTLDEDDVIVISCNNRWGLEEVHSTILKKAGYKITRSEKKSVSGTQKITAKLRSGIFDGGSETSVSGTKELEQTGLELNPEDVNDVIHALDSINFDKKIILEDFHYLPEETQDNFAVALKAFHEESNLNFIIVGVWLEENRMIVKNGDLTGRVISVNADTWEKDDLIEVIEKGAELLNVNFEQQFKQDLVNNCYDSVFIVQEACQEACLEEGILETQEETKKIGSGLDANEIIGNVIGSQNARYRSFIQNYADGFRETKMEMHRWLLYPILQEKPGQLESGLIYRDIRNKIESQHPEGTELNPGNLTQALKSTNSLQSDLGVKPFILDYDEGNKRLFVVDRGFIIWLESEDQNQLLEYAGLKRRLD